MGKAGQLVLPPTSQGRAQGETHHQGVLCTEKTKQKLPTRGWGGGGQPVNSIHADKAYPNILFPPKEPPLRAYV